MSDTPESPPVVSGQDCLYFAERALDGMSDIVIRLGDDLANQRPPLPGANSPYQILVHCMGVCEYWGGRLIAGREVIRDRAAEFTAQGAVAPLVARVAHTKRRLREDITRLRPGAATRTEPPAAWNPTVDERRFTHSEALVHIVEELCQHHGQLEVTRDVLLQR
jgi:hypothetical protein